MAMEELLVELALGRDLGRVVLVPGAEDVDRAGRAGRHHQLGVGVADQVVAAVGAGPFDPAVGSLAQVGEAMDGLHGHGIAPLFLL